MQQRAKRLVLQRFESATTFFDGMSGLREMTGTVWSTPAVAVERVLVRPGTCLSGHGHDVPHLCFLEEGRFEERDARRWREVKKGTLRSSPAGDEHHISFPVHARCLLVLIHGDPVAVSPQRLQERRYHQTDRLHALADQLSRMLSIPAELSPLDVEGIVLELVAATHPEVERHRSTPPPPWLRSIRERLRDAPASEISTCDLAQEAGYHPVYVARAFRQYFGVGIDEFRRGVRADLAHRLLAETEVPITQVALLAGYSDQSHLTRSMRRYFHATPAALRRKCCRRVQVGGIQELGSHLP